MLAQPKHYSLLVDLGFSVLCTLLECVLLCGE